MVQVEVEVAAEPSIYTACAFEEGISVDDRPSKVARRVLD